MATNLWHLLEECLPVRDLSQNMFINSQSQLLDGAGFYLVQLCCQLFYSGGSSSDDSKMSDFFFIR